MTNSATSSTHGMVRSHARPAARLTDEAPMAITRLSGWIDMGEAKTATPTWIIRTRMNGRAR